MHNPAPRLAFPALILANLFLAAGPWLVRLAQDVGHIGPVSAAFWRLALAVPVLAILAARQNRGEPLPRWTLVAVVAAGGVFFAADLAAWHAGILITKLANATLFGNFASFLFTIYGFILLRRAPSRGQGLAFLLAAVGTALLLGTSYELSAGHFNGDLLALLAGGFYTFYLVAVDRARRDVKPWPVLLIASAAGALPLLGTAFILGETIMPQSWWPVIILSISSQLVGQGLLVYAMGHLSPVIVGLCFLLQPLASAAIGWAVYGEALSAADGVGALLICAALVLIRLPDRRLASLPVEGQ
jgi:drug/metabolite transporter (DMT)-like permease